MGLSVAPSLPPSAEPGQAMPCRAIIIITTIKSVESSSAPQYNTIQPRLMGTDTALTKPHIARVGRGTKPQLQNQRSTVLNLVFSPSFQIDVASRARGYKSIFRVILRNISLSASKSEPIIPQGEEPLWHHLALLREQSMMQ